MSFVLPGVSIIARFMSQAKIQSTLKVKSRAINLYITNFTGDLFILVRNSSQTFGYLINRGAEQRLNNYEE
jgi:hypothetical protein